MKGEREERPQKALREKREETRGKTKSGWGVWEVERGGENEKGENQKVGKKGKVKR